ncbi:MAG: NADH-quinone oxidoreductase subunit C, partial [Coriobacteriia bacterium]|nr:NADH-quinone oxidoreductase subunit C [Coriobacteriia bacterium]
AVPARRLVQAVGVLLNDLEIWQLSTITADVATGRASDGVEVMRLLYHFWHGTPVTLAIELPLTALRVDSLTTLIPGTAFYEREIYGMFGVVFEGHAGLRPLLLPDDWDEAPPMRRKGTGEQGGRGVTVQGSGGTGEQIGGRAQGTRHGDATDRVVVPIGPQHPLLKEPLSLQLVLEGERVVESAMRLGYVHRGIERLCQDRSYVQAIHLIERVCGICSHVHTTTYCRAVEALTGLEIPPRAAYLRALLCELERIHSHLLWLGVLARNIGYDTIFMYAWRDREIVLDVMEDLSGGRVSHAVNVIGGVRVDVEPSRRETILGQLDQLDTQVRQLLGVVEHERSLRARTRGIGVLTRKDARRYCVVGPVARASGLDIDLRRDDVQPPYERLNFAVPVHDAGDVWARTLVRVQEVVESVSLCRQLLDGLPDGPISVRAPRRMPLGEAVARSEAPRGEVVYYVRSDGSDHPARVKIRTPTMTNLITLPAQLKDIAMADVSVVLSGVDLCIACADR